MPLERVGRYLRSQLCEKCISQCEEEIERKFRKPKKLARPSKKVAAGESRATKIPVKLAPAKAADEYGEFTPTEGPFKNVLASEASVDRAFPKSDKQMKDRYFYVGDPARRSVYAMLVLWPEEKVKKTKPREWLLAGPDDEAERAAFVAHVQTKVPSATTSHFRKD